MIENTKCECGHQNPLGTVLCESCGKPLQDTGSDAPLEMRYDGTLRRSERDNPSVLDRVWRFFSSVKIAVYLIIFTLLGAALGTLYPQENMFINLEDPAAHYAQNYGTLGKIYYFLGLSHTYQSWWFVTLLLMIGTSLVVCSLDRVLPLYRALSKQKIRKHPQFILRQKVSYSGPLPESAESAAEWVNGMAARLRKKRYRVHTEDDALLAEKNRFSRWGPYINHIGLIIFLLAVLARSIPGWHMDQYQGFLEGQPVKIPETPYYLLNEKFTVEFYSEEEMSPEFRKKGQTVPKKYETQAVLYECSENCDNPAAEPVLKEVHRQNIEVNKPLSYKGLLAYQFDFEQTPMLLSVRPAVKDPQSGKEFGKLDLKTINPASRYEAGPYRFELKQYFPDFALEGGKPVTQSKDPKKPAFVFLVHGPGLAEQGELYMYFPRQIDREQYRQDEINGALAGKLSISADSMDDVKIASYTSYLNIRKDKAMPFIWVGAAISMIGLVMGFYWQHRRIWLRVDKGQVALGAHTNKNWFGLRQEVARALQAQGIPAEPKSLERRT